MPATRFFSLLRAGRAQEEREEARKLLELCRVAMIATQGIEYYQGLTTHYRDRWLGPKIQKQEEAARVLDPADPNTGEMLKRFFSAAEKFAKG